MPKRTDLHSVFVIGSGPIVIGQAAEFDYSGTQAIKALRAEGYRVVLVNSNPATIMTDPELADATYIEPITPDALEAIIAQERPDALLPTVGGQTGLNMTQALAQRGVLDQYGVKLIGASLRSIASTSAPISSTPYFSRTPLLCSAIAALRAVCPPRVGSRASGRSLAMMRSTNSGVIGSTYVASENSGSVMIVAGFEFTSTTRSPSARRTRQAWVPE